RGPGAQREHLAVDRNAFIDGSRQPLEQAPGARTLAIELQQLRQVGRRPEVRDLELRLRALEPVASLEVLDGAPVIAGHQRMVAHRLGYAPALRQVVYVACRGIGRFASRLP